MARCLAILSALVAASALADSTDVCTTVPRHSLTFDCGGFCGATSSCVWLDANATTSFCATASPDTVCHAAQSGACTVVCFEGRENASSSTFRFYVAFITKPDADNNQTDSAHVERTTDDVAYAPNDLVRGIGELTLPSNTTTVIIAGGRTEFGARGFVVDVELDPSMFRTAPQVTSVSLLNMDLANVTDVASLVPQTLQSLDLRNTKLKQLPPSINALVSLQTLVLDVNDLTEITPRLSLPHLQTLRLSDNALTTFGASLPSLHTLDLSGNRLSQFPYDVLSSTNLKSLRLANNSMMKNVIFSASHYSKISELEQFTIDTAALDNSSCLITQVKPLVKLRTSVCVLTDAEWTASTGGSSSTHRHTTVVVIVSVIAVAAGVAIAVGGYWWWIRKTQQAVVRTKSSTHSRATETASGDYERMGDEGGSIQQIGRSSRLQNSDAGDEVTSPTRYSFNKDPDLLSHRINHSLIEDRHVLGAGGYAVVWLVKYTPQNRLLASKRLISDDKTSRQKLLDFVVEIKLNMELLHPSIVEFVGVAWTTESDLQALFEYMPNGDLRSYLERTDVNHAAWDFDKLRITIDVIEALVYVHSFSPPLVHRDLKSRNVLLAEDMKAKLGDFGVSRYASENGTMTAGVGTGKWLAPEVIAGNKDYDESSDIYAFGVILAELDTHQLPYEDAAGPDGEKLSESVILQRVASGQLQPTFRASCPEAIRELAMQCLALNPTDRPSAIGVAYALRRLRNDWYKHKKLLRTT